MLSFPTTVPALPEEEPGAPVMQETGNGDDLNPGHRIDGEGELVHDLPYTGGEDSVCRERSDRYQVVERGRTRAHGDVEPSPALCVGWIRKNAASPGSLKKSAGLRSPASTPMKTSFPGVASVKIDRVYVQSFESYSVLRSPLI